MNILMVSNRPYPFGGKEHNIHALQELLENHGHHTAYYAYAESDLSRPVSQVMRELRALLESTRYDVVHFHGLELRYARALEVAARYAPRRIMSLHDFAYLCPMGNCLRNQRICRQCWNGQYYHGVACRLREKWQALQRRLQTTPTHPQWEPSAPPPQPPAPSSQRQPRPIGLGQRLLRQNYLENIFGPLWLYLAETVFHADPRRNAEVSAFVCPSDFVRQTFAAAGFPYPLITVHNFLNLQAYTQIERPPVTEPYALYAGRLDAHKGVMTLLDAVKNTPIRLRIAGTGSQENAIRARLSQEDGLSGVSLEGFLSTPALQRLTAAAQFAVVPSECWETFGYSALEPMLLGVPVITSAMGGLGEVVPPTVGLHFQPGNSQELRAQMLSLAASPQRCRALGSTARQFACTHFGEEMYYKKIMNIYDPTHEH